MSPREKRSARDVALDALMQVDKANAWSDEALRRLIAQTGWTAGTRPLPPACAMG